MPLEHRTKKGKPAENRLSAFLLQMKLFSSIPEIDVGRELELKGIGFR